MSTLTPKIIINSISISVLGADFSIIRYFVQLEVNSIKNKSFLCSKICIVPIYVRQFDFQSFEMRLYIFIQVSFPSRFKKQSAYLSLSVHSFSPVLFSSLHLFSMLLHSKAQILQHKIITADQK